MIFKNSAILAASALAISAVIVAAPDARAADETYALTIKDHKFQPETLEVPAGTRFKLTVSNQDATPEEFESHDFHVEKMIAGGGSISVFVGPLEAGTYKFVGEMHEDVAKGTLVVK